MNEAETRAELIDPQLLALGWGVLEHSKVAREYPITNGKIQSAGLRGKKLSADYVLIYKGKKLAVIEAKRVILSVNEGIAQAKNYAQKLQLAFTYASNGKQIYAIDMKTGQEKLVDRFPSPDELWQMTFACENEWRNKFLNVPFEDKSGTWQPRYYQENAINNALEAIANKKQRVLLTLATGTGKTAIAFQITWKLFQTRWNLARDGSRRPRMLFLADRNILASQAFNSFSAFSEDVLVLIKPDEIKKKGKVPTNGSIFFTIFQTFMSGKDEHGEPAPYFGEYETDFFDLIIIDECHRGGANDHGNWRAILEYFSPAVQIGLTATPKRVDNVDTYKYFGEPVYVYSLKDGINDGFLTPFKVKRVYTTLDEYIYTPDDEVIEGLVEQGKTYSEKDNYKRIEIEAKEEYRVKLLLKLINQNEKTIIFCVNQLHAAAIMNLINQNKKSTAVNYCVRVTADDGKLGEQYLAEFQDNEKSIPTILTTSQKLSTGVDARNVRNVVLFRLVNSIIEFKQIVGRGTRLFDGKDYFTIYDFTGASKNFYDPEWDGEAIECEKCKKTICECEATPPTPCKNCNKFPCECPKPPPKPCDKCGQSPCECVCEVCNSSPCICIKKVKIKLSDNKIRQLDYMVQYSFLDASGKPISGEEFLNNLFGKLPELFKDEAELIRLWSDPQTRKGLLAALDNAGFGASALYDLQRIMNAENSDLFDVLEYVFNGDFIIKTRSERVALAKLKLKALYSGNELDFIDFILDKYIEVGVEELAEEKLGVLLSNKYGSISDGANTLGSIVRVKEVFARFQQYLYY